MWRSVALHICFVCLLSTSAVAEADSRGSVNNKLTAMEKVIQMLTDMAAKAGKAMHDEQVAFSAYTEWCGSEQNRLALSIKTGGAELSAVSAEISQLNSQTSQLADDLASLTANQQEFEKQTVAHKAQREKDHDSFTAEVQDYAESIDALQRAIAVLQKQNYDRTALLQLAQSQKLPGKAQRLIGAFLGMMSDSKDAADPFDYAAPEANAYEFQSTSIVDLLKKLLDDFRSQKSELEKEEMNSVHSFNLVVQDLTHAIADTKKDLQEKTALRQEKVSETGLLKQQAATLTTLKAEDEKLLEDAEIACREKKASFEEKQVLRKEEIEALEKATAILSSPEAAGSAAKYLSLAQPARGNVTALVQLGSNNAGATQTGNEGIHRRLREFLSQESGRLHSKNLQLLVQKIEADPFAKVKKLIEDMITRLLEEAHSEADHKGFCDKEMGESKLTRTRLQEELDGLSAAIEEGKATVAMLTQDNAKLSQGIAELDKAMKEATEMRSKEKAANEETIEDAAEAIKALQAATAVIKDFYAKAGQATALAQMAASGKKQPTMGSEEWKALANPAVDVDKGHRKGMQTFGDTYKGLQQEAGGVVAMLEVIESDFANLKADTMAAEAAASKEYEIFMAESRKDKATKEKAVSMDERDKAATQEKLREDTSDYTFTEDKLLAANRYYDNLEPQCIDKGMTFEERTKSRAEEIQSLKEALAILSGEDVASVGEVA